jgi:AraC-like DNA-binding protein
MLYFMPPWNFSIQLRAYTYYTGRSEFISTHGRFKEWVMVIPEAGEFDYEVDGEAGKVSFGDFVCAPPGGLFWRHVTSSWLTYHVLRWSWMRGEVLAQVEWKAGKWSVMDTARLRANFEILRPLVGLRDIYSLRRTEQLLADILMLAWEAKQAPPPVLDPTMREAARLLRERALGLLAMESVSNEVGLSPVQFTRRFRNAHGVTPIEYLTRVRLEHARTRLIMTGETLDNIAAQCGWASGQYLSKVFAAEVGMSPGRFRRLHRI